MRFRVLCSGGGEGGDNRPGSDHGNTGPRGNFGFFRLVGLVGSFVYGGQRGVRRSFLCVFTGQLHVQRGIQRLQPVQRHIGAAVQTFAGPIQRAAVLGDDRGGISGRPHAQKQRAQSTDQVGANGVITGLRQVAGGEFESLLRQTQILQRPGNECLRLGGIDISVGNGLVFIRSRQNPDGAGGHQRVMVGVRFRHVGKFLGVRLPALQAVKLHQRGHKIAAGHALPGRRGVAAGAGDNAQTVHRFKLHLLPCVGAQIHKTLQLQGSAVAVIRCAVAQNTLVVQGVVVDGHIIRRVQIFVSLHGRLVQPAGEGVALDGEHMAVFRIKHNAHVDGCGVSYGISLRVIVEDNVALLRDIRAAPGLTVIKPSGILKCLDHIGAVGAFRHQVGGNAALIGAPGHKHGAPVAVGKAVPFSIFGVFVGTLHVADFRQRSLHNGAGGNGVFGADAGCKGEN